MPPTRARMLFTRVRRTSCANSLQRRSTHSWTASSCPVGPGNSVSSFTNSNTSSISQSHCLVDGTCRAYGQPRSTAIADGTPPRELLISKAASDCRGTIPRRCPASAARRPKKPLGQIGHRARLRIRNLIRIRRFQRLPLPQSTWQWDPRAILSLRSLSISRRNWHDQRRHLLRRPGVSESPDRCPQAVQVRGRRHRPPACRFHGLDLERIFTADHDQLSPF